MSIYIEKLKTLGAVENVEMNRMTTFKIGGKADMFIEPSSKEMLSETLLTAKEANINVTVIGGGSNLLVSDNGIEGLVVKIGDKMSAIKQNGTVFEAEAGVLMSVLAKETIKCGCMGLEWAGGIPGRLGGAIAMNAGAYGYEIKAVLEKVEYIENGDICSKTVEETDMGYRYSIFTAPNKTVVSATIKLIADDGEAKNRMIEMNNKRKNSQPLSYPSAGSVFKRPVGHFAGRLIEDAQLKGVSVGGAMVSEKHAGFIINTGDATAKDVLELIELVKQRVFENSGVMLEEEVRFVGRKM